MGILAFGERLRYGIDIVQEKVLLAPRTKQINENYELYTEGMKESILDINKFTEEQGKEVSRIAHSTKFKTHEARFIAILKYLGIYEEYLFFLDKKCINFNFAHIKCKTCHKLNRLCQGCYEKAKENGGKDRRYGDV